MKPLVDKAEISKQQYDAYVAAAPGGGKRTAGFAGEAVLARKDAGIRKTRAGRRGVAGQSGQGAGGGPRGQSQTGADPDAPMRDGAAARWPRRARICEAAELQLSYTTIIGADRRHGDAEERRGRADRGAGPGADGDRPVAATSGSRRISRRRSWRMSALGSAPKCKVDMYGRSVGGPRGFHRRARPGRKLSLLPPENATGNFVKVVQRIPVKILVDPSRDLMLRPGMNVDVTIFTK